MGDWDRDLGPRPRGRAGASVGARWPILAVLAVLVLGLGGLVVYLRSGSEPNRCGAGPSIACDFADQLTVTGYQQSVRTVSGGRTEVVTTYVGPPGSDYLALISAPGLTVAPPREPDTTAKAPVIGVGSSTDPRYRSCAVLVYQVKPPLDRGYANDADRARIARGELAMLRIGLVCKAP